MTRATGTDPEKSFVIRCTKVAARRKEDRQMHFGRRAHCIYADAKAPFRTGCPARVDVATSNATPEKTPSARAFPSNTFSAHVAAAQTTLSEERNV
jgi:hypothetical protein